MVQGVKRLWIIFYVDVAAWKAIWPSSISEFYKQGKKTMSCSCPW